MLSIGERIRYLRTANGLSMKELADIIGSNSAAISNYENNKNVPGGKIIILLSDCFRVSTDWILMGTTELKGPTTNKQSNVNESELTLASQINLLSKLEKRVVETVVREMIRTRHDQGEAQ
ncbi:helix-turn-helix domain-containing protein [Paenibacillus nuruki]|uniref:helix-turn-helix domain-containing protein n=1 Tax=Paenibacillus nuruki TaxID=1886670 RepID=UPI002805AFE2|nr:helix-turn-helix transcriptional regulator [Paenibacillus nuruki]CAJ1316883.1 hypothetical protein AASFL403_16815 [Paenibacillus nuruki]